MDQQSGTRRNITLNLFLFYTVYFALILAEKQILRRGLMGFKLPIKIGLEEYAVGFAIGTLVVILLTILVPRNQYLIRAGLLAVLLFSTIYINYFNLKLFYPPFSVVDNSSLSSLAEDHWNRFIPFELYGILADNHSPSSLHINPDLEEYDHLRHISRFGLQLVRSDQIPTSLTAEQLDRLESLNPGKYTEISRNDLSYRIYPWEPGTDRILVTISDGVVIIASLDALP